MQRSFKMAVNKVSQKNKNRGVCDGDGDDDGDGIVFDFWFGVSNSFYDMLSNSHFNYG